MSVIRLAWLLVLFCLSGIAGAATSDPTSDDFWYGTAADGTPTARLYYFFSPTCPHCQAAKPFIAELQARNAWLEVRRYSVKDHRGNARFYYETAQTLGAEVVKLQGDDMIFVDECLLVASVGLRNMDCLRWNRDRIAVPVERHEYVGEPMKHPGITCRWGKTHRKPADLPVQHLGD